MSGTIVLAGGAEFGGRMADVDRLALQAAGGMDVPVLIIPTAAAPDNNHARAGGNGERWFRSLGATNISVVPLVDRSSANDLELAARLRVGKLIYLLGGFPRYLGETLDSSTSWEAVMAAFEQGAVIAGSSAGAMVLCETYFDPASRETLPGLNLLPNTCFLPHHNTFGKSWAAELSQRLPDKTLVGVDEQTGILRYADDDNWLVAGKGSATIYKEGIAIVSRVGEGLRL